MARKLDHEEPVATGDLPAYRNDVTRSLVRITSVWTASDYHSRFAAEAGVPDEPHAVTAVFHLGWNGPQRPSRLADVLGISAPATSRLIETLSIAGLVIRAPDPADARATLVTLTEAGAAAVAALQDAGDRLSQRLLDGWTDDERETFTRLLHRYADAVADERR